MHKSAEKWDMWPSLSCSDFCHSYPSCSPLCTMPSARNWRWIKWCKALNSWLQQYYSKSNHHSKCTYQCLQKITNIRRGKAAKGKNFNLWMDASPSTSCGFVSIKGCCEEKRLNHNKLDATVIKKMKNYRLSSIDPNIYTLKENHNFSKRCLAGRQVIFL